MPNLHFHNLLSLLNYQQVRARKIIHTYPCRQGIQQIDGKKCKINTCLVVRVRNHCALKIPPITLSESHFLERKSDIMLTEVAAILMFYNTQDTMFKYESN